MKPSDEILEPLENPTDEEVQADMDEFEAESDEIEEER